MILYNSENSIRKGHFAVHNFVAAVLWSMVNLSYSSEPVTTTKYYTLKSPSP